MFLKNRHRFFNNHIEAKKMCMKQYFLLRENKESGPFTLETITKKNLLRSDLIWVEGLSTSWCHPTELDELKEHVQLFHLTERKQPQAVQQPVVVEPFVAAHPQLKKGREYSWLTGSKMHPLVLK